MSDIPANGQRRVLLVVDSLDIGGPARVTASLAAGLRGRGVDTRVAHLGIGDSAVMVGEMRASGVPVLELPLGSLIDPRPVVRLALYLRRERIDLVHTHNRYAHLVGGAGAALARRPVVSTVHNIVETDLGWRGAVRRQVESYCLRALTSVVIAVSEAQRDWYRRSTRLEATDIETHPNAVDADLFRPDPRSRRRMRAELGIPATAPLFVTVAMLRPGKGVRYLLEAAALLRGKAPEVRLAIVGDGIERAQLEARAVALGLSGVVRFLGERADVAALLAAADACVHPSLFEAMPLSVLEAMATGLPVVATGVGGVPEIVTHGRTGLLVPPGNAEELALAMGQLLDQARRVEIGAAARAWIETHASTDLWLDRIQRLYERVLGSPGGCGRPLASDPTKAHVPPPSSGQTRIRARDRTNSEGYGG